MSCPPAAAPTPAPAPASSGSAPFRRRRKIQTSAQAQGEPFIWLTGGALALSLTMIVALVVFVLASGSATFVPLPLVQAKTLGGTTYLGEIVEHQTFAPSPDFFQGLSEQVAAAARDEAARNGGQLARRKFRTGNFDLSQTHFTWINDCEIAPDGETRPANAVLVERREWGRFYGFPEALVVRHERLPGETERELRSGLELLERTRLAAGTEGAKLLTEGADLATAVRQVYDAEKLPASRRFVQEHAAPAGAAAQIVAPDGALRPWAEADAGEAAAVEWRWTDESAALAKLHEYHREVERRRTELYHLKDVDAGKLSKAENDALIDLRAAGHEHGLDLGKHLQETNQAAAAVQQSHVSVEEVRRLIGVLKGHAGFDQKLLPRLEALAAALERQAAQEAAPIERQLQNAAAYEQTLPADVRAALARYRDVRINVERQYSLLQEKIATLNRENAGFSWQLRTAPGQEKALPLTEVVRTYRANSLSAWEKAAIYASRWREFLFDEPRASNLEGGVWPAIVGTVVMTLLMSAAVVPFGIIAALYLREYAKPGLIVSAVRIAINNLAGVPSIVFGVFGLGFFCYIVGGKIDSTFFAAESLTGPVFGKGALVWASFTLALMTLPVVIVATEESLAAVSNSMREGSYACGASKFQTIQRIVLPRALPGIMTGMILAMARGAGEVAPLMLVGALKNAEKLPLGGTFPFLHLDRSFMHLGFHIFDLGFQSQNSEAAKPMVFTTTLLLITIILVLNLTAIGIRSRLRRRFQSNQF